MWDEAKECPGQDHPGQNNKERPKQSDETSGAMRPDTPYWIIRGGTSSRSRRPPNWIIRGQVEADAPDWSIRGRASSRSRRPPDWIIQGQVAEDAPDRIIRGRTRRTGQNPQDRIIRGEEARRPGQDRPGRIKEEELPPRGQDWKQHKGQPHGGAVIQG